MKLIVGITGASGSIYAQSLLAALHDLSIDIAVIMSNMGQKVMEYECGITSTEFAKKYTIYNNSDLFAPVASGSQKWDGMIIVPCSVNTMGAIANGVGDTLLLRAASVTLKESRKLLLVVRETPLSLINLENMCKLARAGVCIMPASPGFYNRPTKIEDIVDGMISRILDQFNVEHSIGQRWQEHGTGRQVPCPSIKLF
ncbi:UbiX family flavin prenyltransferase [Sporomusa sp.]|uniref:UbiX family flavin prenyltransferase n=1 Tax=Sporomusa sp. TaxID=2078658 RepID=UPI002BE35168|nr:UbiX family flavin prenyltransferase [Sporomusa sp.]HWR09007.1 UbiX family flavin prenyltransferase [Sporomusa sp.]